MTSTELMPARGEVLLPVSVDAATGAVAEYEAITRAVVTDDDYQSLGRSGRRFPKRSAFQKWATFYNVSTEVRVRDLTHNADGDLVRCDAIVRATHPSGRYAEGDGACAITEQRFADQGGRGKVDHDLAATAVTRATNRAVSNLIGFGQVSAEEADVSDIEQTGKQEPVPEMLPKWAGPLGDDAVRQVAGVLVELFKGQGVDEPGRHASMIGTAIFGDCEQTMPACVGRLIWDLAAHLADPAAVLAAADSKATTKEATS